MTLSNSNVIDIEKDILSLSVIVLPEDDLLRHIVSILPATNQSGDGGPMTLYRPN